MTNNPLSILIIEDQADIAGNIMDILEMNGFRVTIAYDGFEGIKAAKEILPDLILCDIMMPGLSGFDVLKQLKGCKETALIPFIFLTASSNYRDMREGMELGADDYLLKPFSATDLVNAVKSRIRKVTAYKENIAKVILQSKDGKASIDGNILLRVNNKSILIETASILYISAERQYSKVIFKKAKDVVLRKSLNKWEEILPDDHFIRIHRNVIINISEIEHFKKPRPGLVKVKLLNTDIEFNVSRFYQKRINERFSV